MSAKEEEEPPNQEEEDGAPPEDHALSVHIMQGRGGGRTPKRPSGDPPSSVRSQRTACKHGKGGGYTRAPKRGHPPSSVRSQSTVCRSGGERGGTHKDGTPAREGAPTLLGEGGGTHQEGEGVTPPNKACTPFVRSLIQEMGGNPQDLSRNPPYRKTNQGERENRGGLASYRGQRRRTYPIRRGGGARGTGTNYHGSNS